MRHGTCFRRRLSAHHAGAAPHSAVAELGVVRRCYAHPVNKAETIRELAQQVASETEGFFVVNGPSVGDKLTNGFMAQLRARATATFGHDYAEQRICGTNKLAVDYYFPDEGTIVEIALSLRNANSEFERDILKALMAQEAAHRVERLVFISRPGALKQHSSPSSQAIFAWAQRSHQLHIEVHDLTSK